MDPADQEVLMSVAKVLELSAESPTSFDDALRKGIKRASDTVDEIRGAWIENQEVVVEGSEVVKYRVHMRVTFVLK
jgi:flavin-binding protein dodecin